MKNMAEIKPAKNNPSNECDESWNLERKQKTGKTINDSTFNNDDVQHDTHIYRRRRVLYISLERPQQNDFSRLLHFDHHSGRDAHRHEFLEQELAGVGYLYF